MGRSHFHSKKWGGERRGSGRKNDEPAVRLSVTIPAKLMRQIDAEKDRTGEYRSEVVTRLLLATLELRDDD